MNVGKDSNIRIGHRVRVGFQLTQHIRDRQLIRLFETYFECGKYYLSKDGRHGDYIVSSPSHLAEKSFLFSTGIKL